MRERSLPSLVRSMTSFQLLCAMAQLFYDTDPSRRRLLVDFVGQEYAASKLHLCAVDAILWLLLLIIVAITVEEMHAEDDPTRVHRLDTRDVPPPTTDRDRADDNRPLLDPAPPPPPGVLPTTQKPIAVIRWSMLWHDEAASSTNDGAHEAHGDTHIPAAYM
ncbi:hypothetical protein MEQU1_002910 [Malassezia equina]|uniref:DUF1746 domain-containing protein n=1 Tax=Malassezia equina TaxID=1381935 RepID=A0AAF0EGV3_9BASI|nr:hypothetical protein MEQU1_002910 [Malassezia equina]